MAGRSCNENNLYCFDWTLGFIYVSQILSMSRGFLMSHQGEDGWYPECEICGCGNLSKVVCKDCYDKKIKELEEEQHADDLEFKEAMTRYD